MHLPEKQEKTRGNHSLPQVSASMWLENWLGPGVCSAKGWRPQMNRLGLGIQGAVNDKADECPWWAWWLGWCMGAYIPALCMFTTGINTQRVGWDVDTRGTTGWSLPVCSQSLMSSLHSLCVCMCVELSMLFKVLFKQDGFLTGWGFWRWWYSGFLEPSRTISRWISEVIFSFSFSLSRISYFLAGPP